MNSRTDDKMDEIPGTSTGILENNLTLRSKCSELVHVFDTKNHEITEAMKGLHFSTIDLRNKLSKYPINTNHHMIAQITTANNTTWQVRVQIYPPSQYCWHKIWGYVHKEMNLMKISYYDVLMKNNIFPPWTIVFQPPPPTLPLSPSWPDLTAFSLNAQM